MDKDQIIKDLIDKVRQLQEAIDELVSKCDRLENENYNLEEARNMAEYDISQAKDRARRAEYERQEAEEQASYRRSQIEDATRDLEKARQWGDEYAEARALRKLHDLGR